MGRLGGGRSAPGPERGPPLNPLLSPAADARACAPCAQYRQLLISATEKILKYQSKFRSLEASLDAQALTALRHAQSLEYLCRESIQVGRGVYEDDIPELAQRLKAESSSTFEGVGPEPDWDALDDGECAADKIIESFGTGMADPVARTMPKVKMRPSTAPELSSEIESDSSRNYADLIEDDEISMDSSIVSD